MKKKKTYIKPLPGYRLLVYGEKMKKGDMVYNFVGDCYEDMPEFYIGKIKHHHPETVCRKKGV